MHGPSRATLLTGAWQQFNETAFQSYLQRVLALSSPSSAKQESSISVVENKLKSTLDIDPHPADPREQHIQLELQLPQFGEKGFIGP